ncbi:MAG TPA: hypothetical protein VHL34_20270 [Rhizomicrobium sp.]|jgi:3'-phosphoadenosine 5'-phosphosulfate sulfotransferase|nr:hypothetical protein [Rhizomicrobium sp.]
MDTVEDLEQQVAAYRLKIAWQQNLIEEFRAAKHDLETARAVLVGLQISLRDCEERLAVVQQATA